jgi:protein-tyrosine phosphatase
VPNHFHTYGIQYLSFEWNDTERDVILDPHEQTISNVAAFIEDARSLGESCLIHTREGYSTSFTIFAGYFMLR